MSAYANVADVRRALDPDWQPQSGEPDATDESAAVMSDAALNDAIAQASARVDTHIAGRYQTPVAPVDPTSPLVFPDPNVRYWTRDLAAYLATLTLFRSQPMEQNEPVYLRAQMAMTDLVAVRDGKLALNLPPDTSGDASASAGGFSGYVDAGIGDGLFTADDAGFHRHGYGSAWASDWGWPVR